MQARQNKVIHFGLVTPLKTSKYELTTLLLPLTILRFYFWNHGFIALGSLSYFSQPAALLRSLFSEYSAGGTYISAVEKLRAAKEAGNSRFLAQSCFQSQSEERKNKKDDTTNIERVLVSSIFLLEKHET